MSLPFYLKPTVLYGLTVHKAQTAIKKKDMNESMVVVPLPRNVISCDFVLLRHQSIQLPSSSQRVSSVSVPHSASMLRAVLFSPWRSGSLSRPPLRSLSLVSDSLV